MGINRITKGRASFGAVETPGASARTAVINLPTSAASNAIVGTNVVIPAGSRILDCVVKLDGAPTSATPLFDVGTVTSPAWLLNAVDISAAGIKQGSLAAGAVTFGNGLSEASSASSFAQKPFVVATAVTLAFQARGVTTDLDGKIVVKWEKL